MSKKLATKLQKIFKEIGRFVISAIVFNFGDKIFLKLGCGSLLSSGHSCVKDANGHVVCEALSYLSKNCNKYVWHSLFFLICFFLISLLVWKKKISKAWLVDIVILMLLFFIAFLVVEKYSYPSYVADPTQKYIFY